MFVHVILQKKYAVRIIYEKNIHSELFKKREIVYNESIVDEKTVCHDTHWVCEKKNQDKLLL